MENRIKECQLDLFADRTSAATMRANQLRLWFASMAYVLMAALRRLARAHTTLARTTCGTIRLMILKIGAQVTRSVRRIASPWPAPAHTPMSSPSPMPDYAADPAPSARKPVPSTRKPPAHKRPGQDGPRTHARLPSRQSSTPTHNAILRHKPAPVTNPG